MITHMITNQRLIAGSARPGRFHRIHIVVTPGSGRGEAAGTAATLHDALRARDHHVRLRAFSDLDDLRRWARITAGPSLLIAVGGDGTLNAAAEAALRTRAAFLPVPTGFGNLFASALGHVGRADGALDLVGRGRLVPVDVGAGDGELFLCQESFGLLSDIQRRAEVDMLRPRARGRRYLAYCRTAVRQLRRAPLPRLQVIADGRVVARDAAIVTVANVPAYGPWLEVTPAASPVDGLLDVFVMEGRSKPALLARLLARHLRVPGTDLGGRIHRARRVSVVGPRSARHSLEVVPGALRVLVAPERAAALGRRALALPAGDRPLVRADARAGQVA